VSFAKQKKRNKVHSFSSSSSLYLEIERSVLVFLSSKIKDNEKEETKLQAKRKASVRSAARAHSTHGIRE
jgi:hypothetical protein